MTRWWHTTVNEYAQPHQPKVSPVTSRFTTGTPCPRCGSHDTTLEGTVEADQAILGTDEYVYSCDDCHTEWVREKGGTRWEYLNLGD